MLFLCDHASNGIPAELAQLGLPASELNTHIAQDIGAAELTRWLAREFGCMAILGRWSRLVVDLNRGEDDPTVVAKLSDRRIIPGNAALDARALRARIENYHAPYHRRIADEIDAALERGTVPVLVSIHSFTPIWRGQRRPWHFGVLWDRDGRLAQPLLAELRKIKDVVAGDNEPYSGSLENDCLYRHGTMRGIPHVLIEVRQDLITEEQGRARWWPLLARALHNALHAMGRPTILLTRAIKLPGENTMDEKTRTELEAAAFRRLVAHLRKRTDVQNIDMMNLAGFCRNCLGDWYREAAAENGITLEKDQAREIVYGMPPSEWKKRYQKEASAEQQAQFEKSAQAKTHS
jgi:predicted N-formylglutamate amidohydrolase